MFFEGASVRRGEADNALSLGHYRTASPLKFLPWVVRDHRRGVMLRTPRLILLLGPKHRRKEFLPVHCRRCVPDILCRARALPCRTGKSIGHQCSGRQAKLYEAFSAAADRLMGAAEDWRTNRAWDLANRPGRPVKRLSAAPGRIGGPAGSR